jgi:hypothetical protein
MGGDKTGSGNMWSLAMLIREIFVHLYFDFLFTVVGRFGTPEA